MFTVSHPPVSVRFRYITYVPLFKNILTPGGRLSIPALIASKACSYETGLAVQVSIIKPCWMSKTEYQKLKFVLVNVEWAVRTASWPTVTPEVRVPMCTV